jgi:hypothetical protein
MQPDLHPFHDASSRNFMLVLPLRVQGQERSTSGGPMPRDDAKLQKEVAEIHVQFDHHERATRWILTLVALLMVLALVSLASLLLEARVSL